MIGSRIEMRPTTMKERLTLVEERVAAAHERVDKTELVIREDLAEIKVTLSALSKDIKIVTDWMNRAKGWAAAAIFVAGVLGVAGGILARLL